MIENCLRGAISRLQADAEVDEPVRELIIDKDTAQVPGSPAIADTIFEKIETATVFLSDLTYVAFREKGDGIPNPNVSIEHGWALRALTSRRVISVMNVAQGHPDQHPLPFDLRHVRRPILYNCPADASPEGRSRAKEGLVAAFVDALRAIFNDQEVRAQLQPAPPAEPHPHDIVLLKRFHRLMSQRLRQFLREHNFGTSFRRTVLDPIDELNSTWVGAAFEFHDQVLQTNFAEVQRLGNEFGGLVFHRTNPVNGNPDLVWTKTDIDAAQGVQPATLAVIKAINDKASELRAAMDTFDRVSRDRIRIVTDLHADTTPQAEPDIREQGAAEAMEALRSELVRGGVPELVSIPRLTLCLAPFAATEGRRLDPRRVADQQPRFPPSPNARIDENVDGKQWWTCSVPRRRPQSHLNPETMWRMRLVRPGNIEYQMTIGRREDDDPEILVSGRRLEACIIRNLERMAAIAVDLDLGGPALISISLDGIQDVELTQARPGGRRMREPEVIFPTVKVDNLSDPIAEALHENLDILWQTFGWKDGSPSFGGRTWAGYTDMNNYAIE